MTLNYNDRFIYLISSRWCTFESKYYNGKGTVFEQRVIPTAQVPTVSSKTPESEVDSSSKKSPVTGKIEQLPFLILDVANNLFQNLMQQSVVC